MWRLIWGLMVPLAGGRTGKFLVPLQLVFDFETIIIVFFSGVKLPFFEIEGWISLVFNLVDAILIIVGLLYVEVPWYQFNQI